MWEGHLEGLYGRGGEETPGKELQEYDHSSMDHTGLAITLFVIQHNLGYMVHTIIKGGSLIHLKHVTFPWRAAQLLQRFQRLDFSNPIHPPRASQRQLSYYLRGNLCMQGQKNLSFRLIGSIKKGKLKINFSLFRSISTF